MEKEEKKAVPRNPLLLTLKLDSPSPSYRTNERTEGAILVPNSLACLLDYLSRCRQSSASVALWRRRRRRRGEDGSANYKSGKAGSVFDSNKKGDLENGKRSQKRNV